MLDLKGRLKLIANKTPACNTVCDIGTDHAYLPIFLIQNDVCHTAIAADVKKGPLMAANKNIAEARLESVIETRLGNGLEPIGEKEVDVIIAAGMGGILIKDILENGILQARNAKALILQPMNAPEILREWLYKAGFEIYDEELINEGEKIYIVISARWTGEQAEIDRFHFYIGSKLIERKDPLLLPYITKRVKQLRKAVLEMGEAGERIEEARNKYLWLIDRMNGTI